MLKYRINEHLVNMTENQKREALKEIQQLLGIKRSRLNMIRRARIDDPVNITADQLRKLADFFSVCMEEMLNYQPAEN